jgi:hypothetical protein
MAVHAPELLKGYRSPFDGSKAVEGGWTPERVRRAAEREGHQVADDVLFAGFVFSNSEVGQGAFRMTPRLEVKACTNGLVLNAETKAKPHIGGRLEEGLVQWSQETLQANLALIIAQTKDAVTSFLDPEFVKAQVAALEKTAGIEIQRPAAVVPIVSKRLGFTQVQADNILSHFIKGGQQTAGGVMQAITSVAQTVGDGDVALEMEQVAVRSMTLAIEADKQLVSA